MNGPMDPKKVVRVEYAGVVRFVYAESIEVEFKAETRKVPDPATWTYELHVDKRNVELTISGELLEASNFDEAEWREQLAKAQSGSTA
jgi:hypothetical protein